MKKRKGKKKQGFLRKSAAGIIAGALALTMAVGVMSPATETYALEKVADLDTTTKYTESLGDNASTEYAGRIWTDKTVYDEDSVTIEAYGGTEHTVTNDEDFLVAFSALATSQSISGQTQAPVDVVFVIDLSGSMSNEDSNMTINGVTKSRIAFTVDAVNEAITTLMRNPYARVGVVGYNREAISLLPLDHYTQVNSSTPYFTLNRSTGSSQNARLTVRAVGTSGTISLTGNNSISVVNGTNIQDGLYEGMRLLSSETDTMVTIDGKEATRIPSVIHLSDGAPTWSMDPTNGYTDRNWWEPQGYELGDGSYDYYGNGMLAMMVGAYMKQQIDTNYGLTTAAQKTTLYSIGMGIEDLEESGQRDLAHVTLNPGLYLDATTDEYEDNTHADDILAMWNRYCNNTTARIICGPRNERYELTHPNTGDISGDALKNYVDAYYDADESSSVLDIFTNIVGNILLNAPEVPTEHDPQNPMTSGYITYTDPIGEYMEVKDFKAIIYGGHKYELHTVSEDGTTYTFTETAEGNEVYGSEELSHILITVESTDAGNGIVDQTLKIQVPASLIPIRVNTVTLNTDETVKTHTNNGAYPIRVLYTVGLQDAVENEDGTINTAVLSEEYIENHLNPETGMVDFYSNLYTGTKTVNGMTVGDTTVEFVAASTNPFYYMQNDTYLLDESGNKVTVLNDEENYHYYEEYYHGNELVREQTIRTGAQLKNNTTVEQDEDGYWYRPAGSPRVNRMLEFEGTKSENNTKTAQDFYAPTYDSASKTFKVYLGNNGVLSVEATGALEVSKTVTADEGLTAPDTAFTFTVSFTDRNGQALTGSYSYKVTDETGAEVEGSAGVISNGGTLTLQAGQTATIINLPNGAGYTVTEAEAAGFTTTVNGEAGNAGSGIIVAGAAQTEAFANHYAAEPVTYPTEGGVTAKKYFEGRPWETTDTFVFEVTSPDGSPLPTGEDVTVSEGRHFVVLNGYEGELEDGVEFSFGSIQFTRPGTYHYTIVELTPGMSSAIRLPGVSYTRETYELEIVVADKGDGTLEVTSSTMKKVMDMAGTPIDESVTIAEFTNHYSADDVDYGPVGDKVYTDHSGKKPLTDGMFSFTMTAVEGFDTIHDTAIPAANVPMPQGTVDGVYTAANAGRRISFGQVTYDEGDVGHTYWYELKEVYPTDEDVTTNADGSVTKDGMTYDTKTYHIKVVVDHTADPNDSSKSIITVTPTYYLYADGTHAELTGDAVAVFTNSYEETPVIVGEENGVAPIQGTKTLTGRDMKDGEVFTFTLTPVSNDHTGVIVNGTDISTATAVADGYIELSKTTATVSGSTDGVAAAFDFAQTTFKKQGTFTFNITETIPEGAVDNGNGTYTLDGVTYDAHVCTVTVVVTDNLPVAADDNPAGDGILEAEVSYSDPNNKAEFKNTYKAVFDKSTAIDLYGTKKLTGRPLYDGNFYFSVDLLTDEGTVPLVPNKAGIADASGTYEGAITFLENQEYTAAGEYVYIIREQIPAGAENNVYAGVTYDTAQYKVVVTVSDKGELGSLAAEITSIEKSLDGGDNYEAAENIVFSNHYNAASAVYDTVDLEKVLSSDRGTALEEGQFSFIRTVTYAKTLDNQDASDGIALLKVDGTAIEDPTGTGNDDSKKDIVTNKADGTVTFGDIKFTKKGVYVVEVREIIPADAIPVYAEDDGVAADNNAIVGYELNGIIYDPQVITRTFRVVDNEDGSLVVEVIGLSGSLTFTNREIVTEDANLPGETYLKITKNFTGRDGDKWLETDAFEFTLKADTTHAETAAAIKAGHIEMPADKLTINSTNKDTASFGNIVFRAAGTYQFIVTEIDGGIPGVVYDTEPRVVTVNVGETVNKDTTTLTINNVAYSKALTFDNVYKTGSVTLEGATYLTVEKSFTGRGDNKWLETDTFTFTLKANDQATEDAVAAKDIVFGSTSVTINSADADKKASFGNITFYKKGVYNFVIEETAGSIPGVSYDGHKVYVQIVVTDNDKGNLVIASPTIEGSMKWNNTYDPQSVSVGLNGTKQLDGRHMLETDEFTFTIEKAEGSPENTPMPEYTTVKATMSGAIEFGAMPFNKAGVYKYVITEQRKDIAGVSFDEGKVEVTVTITDNTDGTLSANVTYTKVGGNGGEGFVFINKYTTNPTDPLAIFKATKTVTASEGNSYTMKGGEFEFEIIPSETNPTSDPVSRKTVTNDVNGAVVFVDAAQYTEPGVFVYAIHEKTGSQEGISYDGSIYTLTVTVTDDPASAKLKAAYTLTKDGSPADAITFNNDYDPKEVSVTISGTKQLTGRDLEAGVFKFKLTPVDGAPMPSSGNDIAVNTASGMFHFDPIIYDHTGTFKYIVTEIDLGATGEGQPGYKYDHTEYQVTVEVTDTQVVVVTDEEGADSVSSAEPEVQNEANAEGDAPTGSGILKATMTIDKGEIVFHNTYVPEPVTLAGETALRGTKSLTGRKLNDGEFTFLLKDSTNKTILEAVNKNGEFKFEPLTYTKEGIYYYTITEKYNGLGGVTYDDAGYEVAVTVTDAGGYLTATVEYADSQGNKADVAFKNVYAAEGTTAEIGVAKVLNGRDLKAKEFKFVLKDAEGKVVAEAANDADGKVSFGEIEYTQPGVYKYTVSEEKGDLEYVTYDNTVYTVTVTVTDDSKGNLAAEVDTGTEQIVFENTYDKPEEPTPEEPKDPEATPDSDPDTTPTPSPTPTPAPATPDTGDNTNIAGFVILAVAALAGGIGLMVYRRKRY